MRGSTTDTPTSNGGEASQRFGAGGRWAMGLGYIGLMTTVVVGLVLLLAAGRGLTGPSAEAGGGAAGEHAQVDATDIIWKLLLASIVILLTARIVGGLLRKLHQPHVIGEIIAGIMLGPSLFGAIAPAGFAWVFPVELMPFLDTLAHLGLIFYMFLVGLELNFDLMRGRGHAAIWVSHSSIIAPFLMGVALALWLYPTLGGSNFTAFALFIGAAMAITAFPVLARILTDRGLYRTQLGTVVLTVGAVDDITAWSMLAVIIAVARATGSASALMTIGIALVFTLATIYLVRPVLLRVSDYYDRRGRMTGTFLAVLFMCVLGWALVTDVLHIHVIFGAFLFGAVMPHDARFVGALTEKLEDFSVIFLLPFFFTFSGIRTNIFAIGTSPQLWMMTLAILAVAIVGKWGGSKLAARFAGLSWREAGAIGVLVNCRGLTELIILNIGLQLGVLPSTAFAMLVIMAVVTTLMTEPALTLYYSRDKQREMIREEANAEGEPDEEPEADTAARRILIAVGNPRRAEAFMQAASLLQGGRGGQPGETILLRVVEVAGTEVSHAARLQDHALDAAVDLLRPLVRIVERSGGQATPLAVASGDVGEAIAYVARQRAVDLVVLGGHEAMFGQRLLGGPVGHVLRHAETDVAVIVDAERTRELADRGRPRILVPHRGGPDEAVGLEIAGRIATAADGELGLLGPAVDDDGEGALAERASQLSDRWGVAAEPLPARSGLASTVIERVHDFDLLVLTLSDDWESRYELFPTVHQDELHRAGTPYIVVRRRDGAARSRTRRWISALRGVPALLADIYRDRGHEELAEAEEQTRQRLDDDERPPEQPPPGGAPAPPDDGTQPPDRDERDERDVEPPREQPGAPTRERILLVLAGGERDPLAAEIAFSLGRARDDVLVEALALSPDGLDEGRAEDAHEKLRRTLELVRRGRDSGSEVETVLVGSDRPVESILEHARRGAGLIVASQPTGPAGDGSLSREDVERLAADAPCPVVLS